MHSFEYDPFQKEAIEFIRQGVSVFISAPTGAGKTVVAEVAIEEALRHNGMAIYTAPIKALSNQKYRDFYATYKDRVGILTGDVTLNPKAQLLIMTTEIYRNSLFSATEHGGSAKSFGGEGSERFAKARWVIFDEVHYLDDPERGTVWEEALLLTPRETEILALSATIPNAKELAGWIEKIHGRPVKVIEEFHRPVPLKFSFQCQNEIYRDLNLLKEKGYHGRGLWKPMAQHRQPRMRRGRFHWAAPRHEVPFGQPNRANDLIRQIKSAAGLPCLYFTFSRRRAEELGWEFAPINLSVPEKKEGLLNQFDALCRKYEISHERSANGMRELLAQGLAYHHAGLLPTLKEIIEILFSQRLIQVLITTETFALGVNMPARTVVLDTLLKRSNGPRTLLRVRDLFQMAGRAGRRGMDDVGFVTLRVNPWEVPFDSVGYLLSGKPERVMSRFSLSYATLLNLYRSYEENLQPFYKQTFHAYQASAVHQRQVFGLVERKLDLLRRLGYVKSSPRPSERLTPKGTFASGLYGYELILSELFERKWIDQLDLTDLGLFLLAMVYEPRRLSLPVKIPKRVRSLSEEVQKVLEEIHRHERRAQIGPLSKGPAFQLSAAMERWIGGAEFQKVVELSGIDEGEFIRYCRMTVQLARTLTQTPAASRSLKEKAWRLLQAVNRDPVDAEAELRRSL